MSIFQTNVLMEIREQSPGRGRNASRKEMSKRCWEFDINTIMYVSMLLPNRPVRHQVNGGLRTPSISKPKSS